MKSKILKYLKEDRSFNSGVQLYMECGNNLRLKTTFNRQGFSVYNHAILLEELRKLANILPEEFEMILKKQAEPAIDPEQIPVTTEEKQTFVRDIPEQVRKSIRLRDDFPFLASPDCPDEFKILVHDMISAYANYVEGHKRLFEATTGEDLQEIAATVVENYIENREIWDELNHYKETGHILGKHPIFATTDRMLEIRNMTTAEQVKLQKNLMNNIARTKQKIKDQPDHKNTTDRKASVAQFEVELVEVNRILGLNA